MNYEKPQLEVQLLNQMEIIRTSGNGEWNPDLDLDDLLNPTQTTGF